MSVNMDYSYLFEQMFGVSNIAKSVASGGNMVKMSDLSSPSVQAQLKAAGIDTNSKQYQTVVKSMMTDWRQATLGIIFTPCSWFSGRLGNRGTGRGN